MSTFEAWPKIPRWNREVIITEKIDGTNSAVIVERVPLGTSLKAEDDGRPLLETVIDYSELDEAGMPVYEFNVYAQSRTRLIRPGADNFGFAAWVAANAAALVELLGPGRHFGEWYGAGIQRGYGLDHKRFALFNVGRWSPEDTLGSGLPVDVVPILSRIESPSAGSWAFGEFESEIDAEVAALRKHGSRLVPGFMRPEGVILYHTAARQSYKILLEGDDVPKSAAA